jgi:hypothetical protein
MNATSRAILQTVLSSDSTLAETERAGLKAAIDGESMQQTQPIEYLTVSQKAAAKLLSVSRVTIWRMTRDNLLHPVEIFPGTWRYPFEELAILIRQGWPRRAEIQRKPRALSA